MFMTCIDTRTLRLLALALAAAGTLLTALPAWAQMPTGLHRLQHIVVIPIYEGMQVAVVSMAERFDDLFRFRFLWFGVSLGGRFRFG